MGRHGAIVFSVVLGWGGLVLYECFCLTRFLLTVFLARQSRLFVEASPTPPHPAPNGVSGWLVSSALSMGYMKQKIQETQYCVILWLPGSLAILPSFLLLSVSSYVYFIYKVQDL